MAAFDPNGRMRLLSTSSTTLEATFWNDSTQKSLTSYLNGIKQFYSSCIFAQDSSVTVTNTAAETSLLSANVGTKILPANFFVPGKTIRIRATGYLSEDPTSGATLTWRVKLGTTTVLATGSFSFGAATVSNGLWELEGIITCRTTGASGTVFGQGKVSGNFSGSGSVNDFAFASMVNTSAKTIDTTLSQAVDVTAQWSVANPGNSITCTNVTMEVLG
jgi:hypothetical protein